MSPMLVIGKVYINKPERLQLLAHNPRMIRLPLQIFFRLHFCVYADHTIEICLSLRGAMYTNLKVTDAISKKDHLETFADINSIALNIRKLTIEEKPKFDK
ncbi:hypothetical protein T08_14957 [Trichinella sp. T8]|nr:hypothetical protein T08_14957 [Trichinella sp. T8]